MKTTRKYLAALSIIFSMLGCGNQPTSDWSTLDVGFGKPGAPVSLDYRTIGELLAGQTFEVEIIFSSSTTAGTLHVSLNIEGDATIVENTQAVFNLAEPDKRLTAAINSAANGLTFLNVNALERDESGNTLLGRSFSIPLNIGGQIGVENKERNKIPTSSVDGSPHALKLIKDGDELIIEMPAEQP